MKLSQIPSSTTQIIILVLIIIVLFGYCIGEYYLHFYFFDPLRQDQYSIQLYKTTTVTSSQGLLYAQEYSAFQMESSNKTFASVLTILYSTIDQLYNVYKDTNKNR